MRYAQGRVNNAFHENLFRSDKFCFSAIALARPEVRRKCSGTARRSKQTYAMLTASEKPQKKTGIQKVQPYQPVPSRMGIATMPDTRLTVLAMALSRPKAKARPEAPNQW